MQLAPKIESGDAVRASPEAQMVLAIYNEAGVPITNGLMGMVDRRAEVSLPRLALAERSYPGIDSRFFRGLFAFIDSEHIRRARKEQEEAASSG